MKTQRQLGIWMDHAAAQLIDLSEEKNDHKITSKFTFETKVEALDKSESLMHNKRQQLHESFYNAIGAEITKYDHVLLFGPTNAKTELRNYLREDLHFKEIKIDVEAADKMTDPEKDAYVKNHFKKQAN